MRLAGVLTHAHTFHSNPKASVLFLFFWDRLYVQFKTGVLHRLRDTDEGGICCVRPDRGGGGGGGGGGGRGYVTAYGNTYLRGALMWEQEGWNKNIKCAIMPAENNTSRHRSRPLMALT